mmetsp:Transcript_23342/g.45544  ORF Transcript_23342/g.45544 Transcript_23342/m.45544 type:complete len:378 (-) Transcript_23342:646-1779(-)
MASRSSFACVVLRCSVHAAVLTFITFSRRLASMRAITPSSRRPALWTTPRNGSPCLLARTLASNDCNCAASHTSQRSTDTVAPTFAQASAAAVGTGPARRPTRTSDLTPWFLASHTATLSPIPRVPPVMTHTPSPRSEMGAVPPPLAATAGSSLSSRGTTGKEEGGEDDGCWGMALIAFAFASCFRTAIRIPLGEETSCSGGAPGAPARSSAWASVAPRLHATRLMLRSVAYSRAATFARPHAPPRAGRFVASTTETRTGAAEAAVAPPSIAAASARMSMSSRVATTHASSPSLGLGGACPPTNATRPERTASVTSPGFVKSSGTRRPALTAACAISASTSDANTQDHGTAGDAAAEDNSFSSVAAALLSCCCCCCC